MSKEAALAVRLTLEGVTSFRQGIGAIAGAFGSANTAIHNASGTLFHFVQLGKDAFSMARGIAGKTVGLAQALIGPNETFETAKLQFEQLLGSAEAAAERIKELYAYGAATPFMNPDILQGNKQLQAYGGSALATGDSLKMVGDMASYANTSFSEMSTWVGRAYMAIQNGQPFGEAAMRLMEFTVLTGAERLALEQLIATGATGPQVWEAFTSAMNKTQGSAARLGESMAGAKSTIAGLWQEFVRLAGVPLFDAVKLDVVAIRDDMNAAFDSGRAEAFASRVGNAIAGLYKEVKRIAFGEGSSLGLVLDAAEAGRLGDLISTILTGAAENLWIAIRRGAIAYGPDIARAIVPKALHSTLGIEEPDSDLMDKMRSGEPLTQADWKRLPYDTRVSIATSMAMENADKRGIDAPGWAIAGGARVAEHSWVPFLHGVNPEKLGPEGQEMMARHMRLYYAELNGPRNLPGFTNIRDDIEALNIPRYQAPAAAAAPDPAAVAAAERWNQQSIYIEQMSEHMQRLRDNMDNAATSAQKLQENLANANDAF